MNLNLASIHLADATRLACRAAGKEAADPKLEAWEVADMLKAINCAADALGYTLIKAPPLYVITSPEAITAEACNV